MKKGVFYLLYFLSPVLLSTIIYLSNPDKYNGSIYMITMMLGAFAYTWLMAELILSARAKFIERCFGMDKLYRFHGWMALVSVLLVFTHKIILENEMGDTDVGFIGNLAFVFFLIICIMALVFMANIIVAKVKPLAIFKRKLQKAWFAKYESQVLLHNLAVVALVILLVHVMLTYSARQSILVTLTYVIYFAIAFGFYLYHKVFKRGLLNKNLYTVKELTQESENMWTLTLAPKKGDTFKYLPGQFGFFRIIGKDIQAEEHPFSISSDPSVTGFLGITIKELGDYTSTIKNVKVGDKVLVDAPYGKFSYLNYPHEKGVVLIAGGVGITPILSMIRHMNAVDKNQDVTLIWGLNTQDDFICMDELKEIQQSMKNFRLVPVMFRDDTWEGEKGVIDKDKILSIMQKNNLNLNEKGYYVCGPEVMLQNVLKSLREFKIPKKYVHFEKFSL